MLNAHTHTHTPLNSSIPLLCLSFNPFVWVILLLMQLHTCVCRRRLGLCHWYCDSSKRSSTCEGFAHQHGRDKCTHTQGFLAGMYEFFCVFSLWLCVYLCVRVRVCTCVYVYAANDHPHVRDLHINMVVTNAPTHKGFWPVSMFVRVCVFSLCGVCVRERA